MDFLPHTMIDTSVHVPFSFAKQSSCWHSAMCRPAPTGTCFWHNVPSADFKCGLERDTQRQVWQFMDPMSVVLEVGV